MITVQRLNELTSCRGSLLLIHGTADDNVHYQNCTEYSECISLQANKQFEFQCRFIPTGTAVSSEEIPRNHLMTRVANFFMNNL